MHYFDEDASKWVCDTKSAMRIKELLDFPAPHSLLKLKPYKYQEQGIEFCLRVPGSLLQLPCGAGKSLMGIATYLELKSQKKVTTPGVFVVKASLKNQWADEIRKFSDLEPQIIQTYKAVTASLSQRIKQKQKKIDALIKDGAYKHGKELQDLNHQIKELERQTDIVFSNQFRGDVYILNYETLRDEDVRQTLLDKHLEFFYVDEIDAIKDCNTIKARVLYLYNNAPYKYGATATPIRKNPKDLYGIFKFLQPTLFPSEQQFDSTYLTFYFGRITGSKNEEHLNKKIDPYRFKKSYSEIADQLPSQTVIQKYCFFTPKQLAMHNRLMDEIDELKEEESNMALKYPIDVLKTLPEYQKIENNIVARQNFAQMLADSEDLLMYSDSSLSKNYLTGSKSSKVELCTELIRKIVESNEKVVVFSRYLKMQDILEEALTDVLKENNVKTARITGAVSSEDRNTIIKAFNNDPEYKILFASDAAEAGINIPSAKYMIEMELAESAAKQTQRHGRIQRADSIHKSVFVYQLICKESFDEIAMKIVSKKEKYARDIL